MAEMNVLIKFETNARAVRRQIAELNSQVSNLQASTARLSTALDRGKASSKALTGDIRARQTILKLDKQIDNLARQRMMSVTRGYNFGAQDQFVKGLIKQNEVMRIQRKILDDNANAMINLGKNTQWAGRQLVVGFTVPLTIAAGAAMKAFSDLEKELVKFKRVYGDVGTSTEQTDAMAESVKRLATEWTKYGVAVSDTVGLAAEAAGAGFQDKQLLAQVDAASKLAVLGQLEQQKAMQATIALQSTFKLSNEELGKSINFLNQLENQTMVTMEDMTTAIPKAATVIEGLGGSVEDLGIMMAALREGGVSAAEGANALKSGLGSLLNPSKAATEALKTVGINLPTLWAESEKNGEGVIFVVEKLATALSTLGSTKQQQVIEELFGKHQFARMNALLTNITKGTQAMQAQQVAGSSSLEQALIAQQELGKLGASSLTEFQSAVQSLKAAIAPLGKIIMDVITPVIQWVADAAERFNALPDIVKQITLGFVGLAGVVAPLFLMMLGQMQNLIGNGLKFLNFMRNWGRDTKWVSQENLTLANAITNVDSQLIAENALLRQNAALWESRQRAAMGSAVATDIAVTTPPTAGGRRRRGLRRFASGGMVGGSGSKDTIPALLAPGEFVVNREASKKYDSILNAMNSGGLQGFQGGTMHASHLTEPMGFDESRTGLTSKRAQEKIAWLKNRGMTGNLKMFSRLVYPLPSNVNNALKAHEPGNSITGKELAQYFNPKTVSINNQPFAQTMFGMGVDKRAMKHGSHIGGQRAFLKQMQSWLLLNANTVMTDQLLSKQTATIMSNMAKDPKHRGFAQILSGAAGSVGQVRIHNPAEVAKAAGKDKSILSMLGLREQPGGRGWYSDRMNARRHWQGGGKFLRGIRGFASGGFVPGKGNKDSIPAMLAPGEAVIKKSAAKKFAPILDAMNRGNLGLFAGGKGRRKFTVPEQLRKQGIDQGTIDRLRGQVDNMNAAIDEVAVALMDEVELRNLAIKKLHETYEQEGKTRVDGSHVVRAEIDALTGEPGVHPENIVFDQHAINQLYEDLGKLGPQFNAVEREIKANVALMKEQQKAVDATSKEFTQLQHSIDMSEQALLDISKGRHVLDPAGRAAIGEAVIAAEKKQQGLFSKGTGLYAGAMTRLPTSVFNPQFETASGMTDPAAIRAYNIANLEREQAGKGKPNKPVPVQIEDEEDRDRRRGVRTGRFDPTSLLFGVSLFGDSLGGLTDSMGSLNEAIGVASIAMMGMQAFGFQGFGTGGGLKGIIGKGVVDETSTGIKKAFGKWGLGAGAVGGLGLGILGSMGGNAIQNGQGGTRDALGQAVSWGATGAGLGMMFGPWGAAIGAATGALAGFTVQILANKKAQNEAMESAQNTSVEVAKAVDHLAKTYNLGTGQDFKTQFADLNLGGTEEQKELYEILKENEMKEGGAFAELIKQLDEQKLLPSFKGPEAQLDAMVLKLRATGVSEDDIKLITRAFVSALPEQLKSGMTAATYIPPSTDELLRKLNDFAVLFNSITSATGHAETLEEYAARTQGLSGSELPPPLPVVTELDPAAVVQAALLTQDAFQTLTTILLNAKDTTGLYAGEVNNLTEAQKRAKKEAEDLAVRTTTQLATLKGNAIDVQKSAVASGRGNEFFATLARPIEDLIKSGQGLGLEHEEWGAFINSGIHNAAELTNSAQMLLLAGISLKDAAGNLIGAAEITQMAGLAETMVGAENELASIRGRRGEYKQGFEMIQTLKDEAAEAKKKPAQGNLEKVQAAEDARQRKWDKINQKFAIKNATLDIARINIENKVLKKFIKKFNDAFKTSIDSFADAQYEIDKIGLKIRKIQTEGIGKSQKSIDELQESADDLNRTNELQQRKLDDLQQKEQDRVDAINKKYDEQADALERIGKEHDYILTQQGATADLVQAYSGGNLADIAKANAALNQNVANFGRVDTSVADAAREAEIAASPYQAEIDAITADIAAREKEILTYEDEIYRINEEQIEPLQRRSDLMSLMLDTTRSIMEHQQANALGIDQENFARKEALSNAREALDNARHMFDVADAQKKVEEETNAALDARIIKLQQITGLETTNLDTLEAKLEEMDAEAQGREDRAMGIIDTLKANMRDIAKNGAHAVDVWGNPIVRGGTAATIDQALEYIRTGNVKDPKKYPVRPAPTSYINEKGEIVPDEKVRYTGGAIDGSGGQDSVHARLTPGEYVMRKSAVDRIGVGNLRRMNQGPTHDEVRFAAGGEVPGNKSFGPVADGAFEKIMAAPLMLKAFERMNTVAADYTSGYVPYTGPIPGLSATEPGYSGMAAERASWIKPVAVRMMRYVKHAFPWATGTTYMSGGEHGSGKAVDYWPSLPYKGAGNAQGWQLAEWAKKWKGPLNVRGVIFDDRISGYGSWDGWRPYRHGSGSMSDTDRHRNHAHIINYKSGGLVPGTGNKDIVPAMLTPGEFVLNKAAVDRVGTLPLKALNSIGSIPVAPNEGVTQEGDTVYNEYELNFNIADGSNPQEIANFVMRELQRSNDSKVRGRR